MKKFLLSCTLALGIFANAQFSENFDAATTVPAGWTVLNGGDPGGFTFGKPPATGGTINAAHSGLNVAKISYGAVAHDDYLVTPAIVVTAGLNTRLSFWVASYSASFTENYNVMLSETTATAAAFTKTLKTTSKAPGAWTKVTLDLTPYVGKTVYVGLHAVDTDQFQLFFDDVVNDVAPAIPPVCTVISAPADAATNVSVRPNLTWNAAPEATGYKLYVGTTALGSDAINLTLGAVTSYQSLSSNALMANTKYYARVIAFNASGDATGCTETTFTTGANPQSPYCGPMITTTPTQVAPITSVKLNGVVNTSNPGAVAVGTYAVNETFLTPTIDVNSHLTSMPIVVEGVAVAANGWAMSVFIDWNNDGDFDDAGEANFNTTGTIVRSENVVGGKVSLSGYVTIPAGVTLGNKRVRVKYNFSPATIHPGLETACSDMSNGQVEDYTISVTEATSPVACTTFTAPVNLSTNFAGNGMMTWNVAPGAEGYKLYIGTSSNGTDVENGKIVTGTFYQASLTSGVQYFAKVVPFNNLGDATGCSEISFTATGLSYCDAGATNTSFEKISKVTLGTVLANSSSSTAGYENFTALPATVVNRESIYPMTVDLSQADNDETIVWIDYNQDGAFDASEKTTLVLAGSAATANITIPPTAKLGNTRMRVRMHYLDIGPNATPCGSSTYGQVEDYTIEVKATLAAATTATKSIVAVYPNPFKEVLKISDINGVKLITISDVSGRQVKSMKASSELNLSDLKTGLYIVNLQMEDGTVKSIKAIKK